MKLNETKKKSSQVAIIHSAVISFHKCLQTEIQFNIVILKSTSTMLKSLRKTREKLNEAYL